MGVTGEPLEIQSCIILRVGISPMRCRGWSAEQPFHKSRLPTRYFCFLLGENQKTISMGRSNFKIARISNQVHLALLHAFTLLPRVFHRLKILAWEILIRRFATKTKVLLFLLSVSFCLCLSLHALAAKPDPPLAPKAKVSGTTVDLSWTASTNSSVTEYEVESCTGARCISFTQIGKTKGETSYTDKGLSPGTSYTYRVRAVSADGVSEPSEPTTAPITAASDDGKQTFAGLRFGVGVSYTQTLGRERIRSASVDSNMIVRVDSEVNAIPRIMLESHYFFTPLHDSTKFCILGLPGPFCMETKGWGAGPFVALQPGTDQVIQSIAVGLMWGFKYSKEETDPKSWNLGIGVSVEPGSKTLADGFNDGQRLPAGQTQVLTKDRTLMGIMALLSFGFF